MRRILVAAAALVSAAAVSGALLLATVRTAPDAVYALTRDIPAGAAVSRDALTVVHVAAGPAAASLVGPGEGSVLDHAVAGHDLRSGQLLERGDLAADARSGPDRRYVFIPLKDTPALAAGDRIDLLSITGSPDRPVVTPFALGLEVRAVPAGGVVVVAPSRQASALVYAAIGVRLVAVVADPGARPGQEPAIDGLDQAVQAVHG